MSDWDVTAERRPVVRIRAAAIPHSPRVADPRWARAASVGGGPRNALSVWWEFLPHLVRSLGREPEVRDVHPERPFDQRVYVSDIRAAQRDLGWSPRVGMEEGLARILSWIDKHRALLGAETGARI